MSGGHSVIQNNCRYIFIYSFCATPLNYHGYNLKGFRQTFIWSQHTNVNLIVNYGCIEPLLLKERENENGVRGAASQDVWTGSRVMHTRPTQVSMYQPLWQPTLDSRSPHCCTLGLRHPQKAQSCHPDGQMVPQTCQTKRVSGGKGKASWRCILFAVRALCWLMR